MSWRDRLQKASFRGVEFHYQSGGGEYGRRVQVHEYPLRDKPWPEDIGRKARKISLDVFCIGPHYMDQRDALIAAVEQPGPGTLVHPRMGAMQVTILDCRLRESTREGGMARFNLSFVEAGENKFPSSVVNTPALVATQSDTALASIEQSFVAAFSVENQPEFVTNEAVIILSELTDRLASLSGPVQLPGEVTDFLAGVSQIKSGAASLVRSPASLVSSLIGTLSGVARLFALPSDVLGVYRGLFDFGDDLPSVPGTTVIRQRQLANQVALVNVVQQTAVIEAARASSQIDFDSFQEATTLREELADELESHMLVADDDSYTVLSAVRVAMVRDISARGADLARVVSYTPGTTLPALVVAHQLYGDASQDAAITARNQIPHPGFITGGQALEVLTRDGFMSRSTGRAGGTLTDAA